MNIHKINEDTKITDYVKLERGLSNTWIYNNLEILGFYCWLLLDVDIDSWKKIYKRTDLEHKFWKSRDIIKDWLELLENHEMNPLVYTNAELSCHISIEVSYWQGMVNDFSVNKVKQLEEEKKALKEAQSDDVTWPMLTWIVIWAVIAWIGISFFNLI